MEELFPSFKNEVRDSSGSDSRVASAPVRRFSGKGIHTCYQPPAHPDHVAGLLVCIDGVLVIDMAVITQIILSTDSLCACCSEHRGIARGIDDGLCREEEPSLLGLDYDAAAPSVLHDRERHEAIKQDIDVV